MIHHTKCQTQAWDTENVPCDCPRGWPRRSLHESMRKARESVSKLRRTMREITDVSQGKAERP